MNIQPSKPRRHNRRLGQNDARHENLKFKSLTPDMEDDDQREMERLSAALRQSRTSKKDEAYRNTMDFN